MALRLIDYGPDGLREAEQATPGELATLSGTAEVSWVDVTGVHDAQLVQAICTPFSVHPLAVEDVLNTSTRPKSEDHGDHLLLALRVARFEAAELDLEGVSLVLGPSWVITFQERPGDVWDPVRDRIRTARGRIRGRGADYLLHALLDAVVDGYFVVLEQLEDRVEALEDRALSGHDPDLPRSVHELKGTLMALRRAVSPLREALGQLAREESGLIEDRTRPFLRDLTDHVLQVLDLIDASRDRLVGVLELHLAVTSHRLNEVMRVLTVISAIFIPLTFLPGIWGMNFEQMPELGWRWGYPAALGLMGVVAAVTVVVVRRNRWL